MAKEALLILIRAAILVLIYSLTHRARVSLNSPLLVCIHSRLIWIQTALIMATCSTPRPRSNMFYVLIKLTGMLKRYFMVKGLWFYWNYIFQIFHVCSFICFFFLIKFEGFGMKGKGKMVKRITTNGLLIEILYVYLYFRFYIGY